MTTIFGSSYSILLVDSPSRHETCKTPVLLFCGMFLSMGQSRCLCNILHSTPSTLHLGSNLPIWSTIHLFLLLLHSSTGWSCETKRDFGNLSRDQGINYLGMRTANKGYSLLLCGHNIWSNSRLSGGRLVIYASRWLHGTQEAWTTSVFNIVNPWTTTFLPLQSCGKRSRSFKTKAKFSWSQNQK